MNNKKTNILLLAMLAASPLMVNAQDAVGADTISAKKKVHVAFSEKDADQLLGGVSYVDMEELQKKDYTIGSLDDLYGLVGGWNGNNLWGMDNDRLDNNDNGNLPLVIIDGIKRPSNNVLPSEIEQVTFLKGAQAVVLYGPKAVKGAILITTKRSKVDGLKIVANANTGWHVAKALPEYVGSAEYMNLYNEACRNDQLATGEKYSQQDIYNYASGINPYRYPNVNLYSDEYIRKAYNRSEGTLEIQGGGTRAHFYTNINYYRIEDLLDFGPAKDNYTDRFSVRGNVDLVVNKYVKGFANATATFYNANKNKGDFWGEAATMRPNRPGSYAPLIPADMVDPNATMAIATLNKSLNLLDGKYFPGGNKAGDAAETNAIADCYFGGTTTDVSRQFQFDAGIIYDMNKFVKGLTFQTQFAIDYAARYSMAYDNKYAVFAPTWSNYNSVDAITSVTQYGDEIVTGHMGMSNSSYRQTISWNGHFNYDNTFDKKHHVTGVLVGNMYTTTASGEYHRYTNANLGLQVGYDYMRRYFANFAVAGVHSSRLPEGNREALSPSFTLGWNIAKENFMKDNKIVDDLLISASYSDLNEDMDVYLGDRQYYAYNASWTMGSSNFSWGEDKTVGLTYSQSGNNPVLDYIHRKEFSVNLRGSFLNKLITADITFFNTDMSGYIIQDPSTFPSYLSGGLSGSSFKPALNHNITNRKGIDLSIKGQKQFGEVYAELGLTGAFLWTRNSKYDEINQYPYQNREGKSLDAIWGYQCLGFYTYDDFKRDAEGNLTSQLRDGLPTPKIGGSIQPGDLKYVDFNKDGYIDSKDQVELGKSGAFGTPFMFGMNLTLKYKNFTLFMVGSAQFGAYGMRNNSYYYMQGEDKYSVNARGRWTPEAGDRATHPRLTTLNHQNNAAASTFWMYSTDRIDLRKVQITYDFPKEMLTKLKVVNGLSVYVNGNDLLTIAKWRPLMETSVGSAPQTRFYNLGVKVTF